MVQIANNEEFDMEKYLKALNEAEKAKRIKQILARLQRRAELSRDPKRKAVSKISKQSRKANRRK